MYPKDPLFMEGPVYLPRAHTLLQSRGLQALPKGRQGQWQHWQPQDLNKSCACGSNQIYKPRTDKGSDDSNS